MQIYKQKVHFEPVVITLETASELEALKTCMWIDKSLRDMGSHIRSCLDELAWVVYYIIANIPKYPHQFI